ncbi:MAG TPA: 2OG-Fe dioxygenase family protein [Steroidobacteraceae bacterium]|nr:2OG-Fe dioxygenase family protein [Steroidobacteraceae bacterium]
MAPTPLTGERSELRALLTARGYALLPAHVAQSIFGLDLGGLDALKDSWERLPRDRYLRDGGQYRARRHSCFIEERGMLEPVPHRAHWQPTAYNALHGGLSRWFEPIEPEVVRSGAWRHLVSAIAELFAEIDPVPRWFVEAHQFRIDTPGGIGRPTPEGAHRDGVNFVAVVLVARGDVSGGETRVFDAQGPSGVRFTMQEPWSMLLMDDARVIHETTPIQAQGGRAGVRDTLVLTYRAQGFQAPAEEGGA